MHRKIVVVCDRLASRPLLTRLIIRTQYVLLIAGLVAAFCFCGSLGIIVAFLVFNFKVGQLILL